MLVAESAKGVCEAHCDLHGLAIAGDGSAVGCVTPGVRNGLVCVLCIVEGSMVDAAVDLIVRLAGKELQDSD